MADIIENQQLVRQDEMGQRLVGRQEVGNGFEEGNHLIREIAHQTAPEAGKAGQCDRPISGHERAKHLQGIALVRNLPRIAAFLNLHRVPKNPNLPPRGSTQKAVAPPALAAFHTFQQKDWTVMVIKFGQGRHRRLRIGQDVDTDRHQVSFAG